MTSPDHCRRQLHACLPISSLQYLACVIADELGVDCIQVSITSTTTSTTSRRRRRLGRAITSTATSTTSRRRRRLGRAVSQLNFKDSSARGPITAKLPIGYSSSKKTVSVTIKPDSSNSPSLSIRRRLTDAVVIEYEGEFA